MDLSTIRSRAALRSRSFGWLPLVMCRSVIWAIVSTIQYPSGPALFLTH